MWARQQVRLAASGQRVVLQSVINTVSKAAQRLFEREGYQAGHSFLRISFVQYGENEQQDLTLAPCQRVVDIGLGQQARPFDPALLGEQDGLRSVSLYRTYEKELRPATSYAGAPQAELQALSA